MEKDADLSLLAESWLTDSHHARTVWRSVQQRHLDAQTGGLLEIAVDGLMDARNSHTLADLDDRIAALQWRVNYVSRFARAVYQARQRRAGVAGPEVSDAPPPTRPPPG